MNSELLLLLLLVNPRKEKRVSLPYHCLGRSNFTDNTGITFSHRYNIRLSV